jgi:hypothetical protein
MILKAFHEGCLLYFSNNELPGGDLDLPPPVLEGADSETAADALDGAMELDVENGNFKGKLWVFELMKDAQFSEKPHYVEFGTDT